jgi:hypothetical protein
MSHSGRALLAIFHLAEAVIVEADDIEDLGRSADLGMAQAPDHVEGEKGVVISLAPRRLGEVGPVGGRHHPDERIDVDHPRSRSEPPDRLDRRDVRPGQGESQPAAGLPILSERRRPGPFAGHVAEEGDLVDRSEERRRVMGPLDHVAGRGDGIVGETLREALRERVGIVRIAVMAQVPDRLDAVAPLRLKERVDAGEIVGAAALVDHRPGDALARDGDAERAQHPVILVGVAEVLRFLAKVASALVFPDEGRAFEARQEEGREDALAAHVKAPATRFFTRGSGMIR